MSAGSENLDEEIKVRVDTKLKAAFYRIASPYKKAADHQRQAMVEYLQRHGVLDAAGELVENALNDRPSSDNRARPGGPDFNNLNLYERNVFMIRELPCGNCRAPIPVEVEALRSGAEEVCPVCQHANQFLLQSPPPRAARAKGSALTEPPPQRRIEDTLESVGFIYLAGGVIVGLVVVVLGLLQIIQRRETAGFTLLLVGLGLVGQAVVMRVLFQAAAEVVRLLRTCAAQLLTVAKNR